MLQLKSLSDMNGISVFTDQGDNFGIVIDSIINQNKISAWKIKASQGSNLFRMLRGARGVIVPYQMVKAIGDIMIINHSAIPNQETMKKPKMMGESEEKMETTDEFTDEVFL